MRVAITTFWAGERGALATVIASGVLGIVLGAGTMQAAVITISGMVRLPHAFPQFFSAAEKAHPTPLATLAEIESRRPARTVFDDSLSNEW